jgi:hypothetical protein
VAFKRRSIVVFLAALLTVFAASSTLAAPPVKEPLVIEDADFDNLCAFPVRIEITANKEYVKFFSDGRILVNGKLFARITNLDTDQSMDVNISGPAHITLATERTMGRGILLLFPEDATGPGLLLLTGRVDVVRGEDGFITNYTVRGTSVNVCAALAA